MIEIEATCITCGADFTPAPDAFRRGTWRTCTRCRGDPGEEVSGVIEGDSKRAQGSTPLRYGQVEEKDVNND